MTDAIAILDFGSQTTQLIARRVREAHVYCEIFAWDADEQSVLALHPKGIILSGGPASVYADDAPKLRDYVLASGLPVLGICYGMQLLAYALGGRVSPASRREYGLARLRVTGENPLLPVGEQDVWMSHGDRIDTMPPGFVALGQSSQSPFAAMGDETHQWYGLQFHPEVVHTPGGKEILRRFAVDVCGCEPDWDAGRMVDEAVERIRHQVGTGRVLAALSGGVDSTVAAALVVKALGATRLSAVFVDGGLLRKDEARQVPQTLTDALRLPIETVHAEETFLGALRGITDPEAKRKAIGQTYIRVFQQEAQNLGTPEFLLQGTTYPDVVESSGVGRKGIDRIKSHHNVGGLPSDVPFGIVEPLRFLFKDEVRAVGEALGLPASLVWRQPFPGPGLAVRCVGEVTKERLSTLRQADAIFTEELEKAGLLNQRPSGLASTIGQAFAVLLPVRSVGVMGDQRTYEEAVALRAVVTEDFMTADWARLPVDLLARVADRIVNEVHGVNRVLYDVTSKPPGTIEWE